MISRRRHTRDGTRRRFPADLLAAFRGHRADRRDPNAPRSDDDPATQEAAASSAAAGAAAAAAIGDTPTARTHAKAAARAAAAARSGANSTGSAADTAAAGSAEAYAIAAVDSVLASLSTYTTNAPECRTRGGTATLIGHSEFADAGASSPPKKYRIKTAAGTLEDCAYSTSSCGGSQSGAKYEYLGTCSYDALTGAVTNTLNFKQYNNAGVCPATTLTLDDAQACTWGDTTLASSSSCLMSVAVGKTLITREGTGTCCSFGSSSTRRTGSMTWALSDEDTENDAIARLQAAASWSSWSAANSTSCKASYEQRTSGFSFAYTEAAFRDTISIPSGQTGILKVGLYRRARGSSDPWVHYATEVFFLTGDGSNQDTIEFTYAADPGFEAYAAGLPVGS